MSSPEELSNCILDVIPFVMREIRTEMRGLAQPELSVTQFRILARLSLKPHSNRDLAEWIGVSTAAMSRTIDLLVKRGFVLRKETAMDRRELRLCLTPKGKKRFESIRSATKRKLVERLKPLSRSQRTKVQDGLMLVAGVFQR